MNFRIYDSANVEIGGGVFGADHTATELGSSTFPENYVSLAFSGIAAYATFDFLTADRHIIDNFEGIFGSTKKFPHQFQSP